MYLFLLAVRFKQNIRIENTKDINYFDDIKGEGGSAWCITVYMYNWLMNGVIGTTTWNQDYVFLFTEFITIAESKYDISPITQEWVLGTFYNHVFKCLE